MNATSLLLAGHSAYSAGANLERPVRLAVASAGAAQ
jgi:hypothetical protein